jgi:C_GCAxxG_C_C family probable redox protein
MGLVNGRPDNIGTLLEEAQSIHTRGYNCAETALWALAKYWQLHCSTSYVTGLGGGVARSGETCGALTGAIVALGLKVGRTEPEDEEKKGLCYRFGQEIVRRFRDEIGTTQCREIIGFTLGADGGAQRYATGGFKKDKCRAAIEVAILAAIAATADSEQQ